MNSIHQIAATADASWTVRWHDAVTYIGIARSLVDNYHAELKFRRWFLQMHLHHRDRHARRGDLRAHASEPDGASQLAGCLALLLIRARPAIAQDHRPPEVWCLHGIPPLPVLPVCLADAELTF